MGWNVVDAAAGSTLFKGLDADTRFYFVHSYAAQQWEGDPDARLTWATHHVPFLAAVEDGALAATQFHPEKSGDAGAALLAIGSRDSRLSDVSLILLPAVDVVDGKAVRLVQGVAGSETDYGSALDAAMAWQRDGAEWIHLVDLDAAFGRGSNRELLAEVIGKLDVAVELSGGIRDDESLRGCAGHRLRPGQSRHRGAGEPAVVRAVDRRARRQGRRRTRRARSPTAEHPTARPRLGDRRR